MFGTHHPQAANRTAPTTRTNNACGSCRFRKVKCSGSHPCTQCAHLGLTCAFAPPSVRRKNGARGALVQQLQRTAKTIPRNAPIRPLSSSPEILPPPSQATPYTAAFFLALVPDYEQVVYPVNPIITADEIRAAVATMYTAVEDAALVYAFAAITMIFLQPSHTPAGDEGSRLADLMHRGLVAHRASETASLNSSTSSTSSGLGELHVTVKRVMTCMFLDMAMLSTGLLDRGFVVLREAIALLQTLKVTNDTPPHERARCQRLYWECFLHERFLFVINSRRTAVLPPLRLGRPLLPDPTIPAHVHAGFGRLVDLFCIIDDTFIRYWGWSDNDDNNDSPGVALTADWVEQKQAALDAEERTTASLLGSLTELQHVDIFITRLWLRTLVWQLALARGLLRSSPPESAHEGLSLHFPADRLSAQLRGLVCRLDSAASIATHGSGILQKLFEITTTIADVLALPAMSDRHDAAARMDDFVFLVRFLFRFDKVRPNERRYIGEKLATLQEMYHYEAVEGEE
ncbi:hypothetical protein SCUCBS95973_007439 [Sporothrix curviconia]|uniref:Zn(2)-C6 fungal-type domain-containing protein n=1 Tax=Sporothrix curviconia TaxID=1260050 RepID=A0ABP0CF54_9PEZI